MEKKVKRGFFGYLFILIGIALAAVAICVVIMFFSPGTQILGFSYFKENYAVELSSVLVFDEEGNAAIDGENQKVFKINGEDGTMNDITNIVINSNLAAINVYKKPTNSTSVKNALTFTVESNVSGFAKGDVSASFKTKFIESTKTLQVDVVSPTGFLNLSKSAKIIVEFPVNFDKNINLTINSEQGNISLGSTGNEENVSQTLTVSSLNAKTTTGKITANEYFTINGGESSFKTTSGDVVIQNNLTANTLKLETSSGDFNLFGTTSLTSSLNVVADKMFLDVKDLTASSIDFNIKGGKIYADTITGNVTFSENANNCNFQTKVLNGNLLVGNVNTDFNQIQTQTVIDILEELNGSATIATLGDVNIAKMTKINGTVNIKNVSSNININRATGELNITTKNGNINLGQELDGLKGINCKLNIVSAEKANINVYFDNVKASSSIESKGNVSVYFNNLDLKATITAKSIFVNGESKTSPLVIGTQSNEIKITSSETVYVSTK